MVMLTLVFQEKRDGNHWGRRRGECCAEGVGVLQQPGCGGLGLGCSSLLALPQCHPGRGPVLGWGGGSAGMERGCPPLA